MKFYHSVEKHRTEVFFTFFTILFSLLLAIYILGWPHIEWGISPEYHGGDDAGGLYGMRQIMENGFTSFMSDRLGFPFGVDNRVYPPVDAVTVLLVKFCALFTNNPATVMTWAFIASFVLAAMTAYFVLLKLSVHPWFSFIGAQLFAFIPFHSLSAYHFSLAMYYTIPIGVYYFLKISSEPDFMREIFSSRCSIIGNTLALIFSMQTTLYFIVFNLLIVGFGVLARFIQSGVNKKSLASLYLIFILFVGVGINWSPTLYAELAGLTPDSYESVNVRLIKDSEFYAGRLSQMLLPHPDHRSSELGNLSKKYYTSIENNMVNENNRQYLGLLPGAALLLSFLWVISARTSTLTKRRLFYMGMLNIFLFFFLTIGGFGILFACFISPIVRCWNRLSIPIACASIFFMILGLQEILRRYGTESIKRWGLYGVSGICLVFGLWDQTLEKKYYDPNVSASFKEERLFYKSLENIFPADTPVYVIPTPPLPYSQEKLGYSQLLANVYAPFFKYSFGINRGFEGASFYDWLEKQPLDFQIDTVKSLGFGAVMFYRNGFPEKWQEMEAELSRLLDGLPVAANDKNGISVFTVKDNKTSVDYRDKLKYLAHNLDFTKLLPPNVKYKGLSGVEPWGRWSDGDKVIFTFSDSLPSAFTLIITASAFADNNNSETAIFIGDKEFREYLKDGGEVTLHVDNNSSDTITFIPPKPQSPWELNHSSSDTRNLGIGFINLKIIPDSEKTAGEKGAED